MHFISCVLLIFSTEQIFNKYFLYFKLYQLPVYFVFIITQFVEFVKNKK